MTITSTRPGPSATTATLLRRRVTVGVHGWAGCPAAVAWATDEARRAATELAILECVDGSELDWRQQASDVRRDTLHRLLRHAPHRTAPTLEQAVGPVGAALLAASRRSDLLVLGREPEHEVSPLLLELVACTPRPVAVVPRTWLEDHAAPGAPVVVVLPALRPGGAGLQMRALSFALVAARRRGIGIHVLAGWQPFAVGADRAGVLSTFRRRTDLVRDAVRTVSMSYPEVPVQVSVPVTDLATELGRVSRRSRMVVLPRAGQLALDCLEEIVCPLVVVP